MTTLRHPHEILRIRRVLAGARDRGHATTGPRGAIKFIGDYLSLNFTPRQRLNAVDHHYRFLATAAPDVRIEHGLTLWRAIDGEGRCHDLVMQPSWMAPMEGEAELCFRLDGERLFTLTFSVIDGRAVGRAGPVLYVGAVQGAYFARDRIRYAARQNGEIAPLAMLLLGASAVAEGFGITAIAGPSNAAQVASRKSVDGRSSSIDYDELWQSDGGVGDGRGHFLMPVGAPTAADDEVSGKHRARTRRRRLQRIAIRAAMHRTVAAALHTPPMNVAAATVPVRDTGSGGGRERPASQSAVADTVTIRRKPDGVGTLDQRVRASTAYVIPLLYEAVAIGAL